MKLSRGDIWVIVLVLFALVTALLVPPIGWSALVIFPSLLILLLTAGHKTVPNNERWVVEIFGAYNRILGPGLHFLVPGIEQIRAKQSIAEQHREVQVQKTLTQDDIAVDLRTKIFFILRQDPNDPSVLEESVRQATYGVEADADGRTEGAIEHFAHATLRSTVGSQKFDWVTDHQKDINALVIAEMKDGVAKWGRTITRHIIEDLLPQPEVAATLLKQFNAEKDKVTTELDADAKRYKDVQEAEAQKQTRILIAQAKAEEQIQDARGEAEGIRARGEALKTAEGQAAAQYNLGEQAIAAIRELAQNTTTLVIPASIADAAGIAETVKKLLGKSSPGGPTT